MELTKETLAKMAEVDIRTVDISELTDLQDIEIDTSQSVEKNWRPLPNRQRMSM